MSAHAVLQGRVILIAGAAGGLGAAAAAACAQAGATLILLGRKVAP
ncbi:MAG: short-chain dehydrogenase, partial [Xanthomonadaceae bacterium]|nr:short-chain dehydrogenase [Xanthomonadaceae bacterium]